MSYGKKEWRGRYSERTDLSTNLVHLTRPTKENNLIETMFNILTEQKLKGSTTESGFIIGDTPAVCFQDAPLTSVCQNCWFEQKMRENGSEKKIRYIPSGFLFDKQLIFKNHGRPVIYDITQEAKSYLPKAQWWRIVNFDIQNDEKFIDWTHEREWRIPGDFEFNLEQVTLLFTKSITYKQFIEKCDKENKPFYKQVAGIIDLEKVLF
jgi:hypothetical protein